MCVQTFIKLRQRFMSYLANTEKNSDENNTVRRYRADSKNVSQQAITHFWKPLIKHLQFVLIILHECFRVEFIEIYCRTIVIFVDVCA